MKVKKIENPVNNDEIVLDKDLIDFYEGENSWFPDVEFYFKERTENEN